MKKEIEICDICKKVVAETKCEFCGMDLCSSCQSYFGVGTDDKIMFAINCCSNCNGTIQGADLETEFKNCPNTKRELIDIFRRIIQLEELEGKVKKKKPKEKETYPGLFNRFYPTGGTGITPPRMYAPKIYNSKKDHSFAWAASKAGKISRFKVNPDDEDDKA